MKKIKGLNRLDLAALIAATLKENGIDVVLTGGSCVSIYSSEQYVSHDLDFVDVSLATNRRIGQVLKNLGFENKPINSRHFAHPDSQFTVEFPSAPLTIGDEYIDSEKVAAIETDTGVLRLLSPTDCVKDRLANYYYFKDRQCLDQALLVARAHSIDMGLLEQWHKNERQMEAFEKFIALLKP